MYMDKIKELFYVYYKSKSICSHTVWSRKFIKYLTSQETEKIIFSDFLEVFINTAFYFKTNKPSASLRFCERKNSNAISI